MFQFLRYLWWDISSPVGRFRIKSAIIRNWPGNSGAYLRRKIYTAKFERAGKNVDISEGVSFRNIEKMIVGNNVALGVDNFFQAGGGIEIGDNTILGPGVRIWSQNHVFADADTPVRDQGYEYKKVTIGRDVWIGANVFIMPGAEIGDRCIVSAGAVVGAKKIPAGFVLAGNPARAIGKREATPEAKPADASEMRDDK